MSLPSIFSTSNSIFPSSINIVVPGSTSLYKSLYVIDVFVLSPIISSFTNVNVSSAFKVSIIKKNNDYHSLIEFIKRLKLHDKLELQLTDKPFVKKSKI